ncbi:hypothetical protein PENSPDRAFT_294067 [Peniophora sp. CONT]|nr:hypothetical protein PENSPDRAFT_294067 [Peniophora sp. CONT]
MCQVRALEPIWARGRASASVDSEEHRGDDDMIPPRVSSFMDEPVRTAEEYVLDDGVFDVDPGMTIQMVSGVGDSPVELACTHLSDFDDLVMPSLLPTVQLKSHMRSVTDMSTSTFCLYITPYHDLRVARTDADLEKVQMRLQEEWKSSTHILLSMAAIHATVFGFSSNTAFTTNAVAYRCLAFSTASSALGIVLLVCLHFTYSNTNAREFEKVALGIYSSYFFFSITSRLPRLAVLVSLVGLALFLITVAFLAWSNAVVTMCAIGIMLANLQYLVKALELLVRASSAVVHCIITPMVCLLCRALSRACCGKFEQEVEGCSRENRRNRR